MLKALLIATAALFMTGCLVHVGPLVRDQRVKTETAIDGFAVTANPAGAAGWRVDVLNNTDSMASVVWDESTFVTSQGQSAGRLVSGGTLKIDTSRAHPATPIAPHARVTEFVIPEAFTEDEELETRIESELKQNDGNLHGSLAEDVKHGRERRARLIVDGKLYVTVQGVGGKLTWSGTVSATDDKR